MGGCVAKRQRDEPYRVLSRLGQRLEATLAPDAVLSVIVETVAQALKLDAARNLLVHDPSAADALLVDLKKQTQTAVADIRHLAYELRPPSLDELGLIQALREQVEQYIQDGLPMTNVVRHAQARTCTIRFALDHGLEVEICDDGRGIAPGQRSGVGLTLIRERAAELGGTCEIEPRPAGGTRLLVRLPLAKE